MQFLLIIPRVDNILVSFQWKITKTTLNVMCFPKSDQNKQKKTLPGMHHTEVRSGDAPKPQFSIKTNNKLEKSENQDSINHPYF